MFKSFKKLKKLFKPKRCSSNTYKPFTTPQTLKQFSSFSPDSLDCAVHQDDKNSNYTCFSGTLSGFYTLNSNLTTTFKDFLKLRIAYDGLVGPNAVADNSGIVCSVHPFRNDANVSVGVNMPFISMPLDHEESHEDETSTPFYVSGLLPIRKNKYFGQAYIGGEIDFSGNWMGGIGFKDDHQIVCTTIDSDMCLHTSSMIHQGRISAKTSTIYDLLLGTISLQTKATFAPLKSTRLTVGVEVDDYIIGESFEDVETQIEFVVEQKVKKLLLRAGAVVFDNQSFSPSFSLTFQ
ncbi:hypothetical protein PCE1_003044 [Barthelona sp. PCE]